MEATESRLKGRNVSDQRFVCGCVLFFEDGGDPEQMILHRGTQKECEEIGRLLPGVSYSGNRPLDRAEFVIRDPDGPEHQLAADRLKDE